MASIFWNSHSIIFIDCLENVKIIIGEYHVTLLDKIWKDGSRERVHTYEEVISETETYFAEFEESYYSKGIKCLKTIGRSAFRFKEIMLKNKNYFTC